MKRALISGITGHLGRELSDQLAANGFEVHGLTRQEISQAAQGTHLPRLHRIDERTETLIAVLDKVRPQTVFHLAAMNRREHDPRDIAPLVQANVLFGAQLLEAMRVRGCSRLIMAGSCLQHVGPEGDRAANLYAATKQAFESLLKYYVDAFNFSAIWLTLSHVYGEHHARSTLMTDIAAAWKQRSSLTLLNPNARVDLVHVEDAARAFVQAAAMLEESAAQGRLLRYSVTSGQDTSATEVVRMFERLGSRRLILKTGEPERPWRSMRPWRGNVMPGWVPRISLEEGILRILEHADGLVDLRASLSGGS